MFKQSVLEKVLACALSTGGDFAEIYGENTRSGSILLIDGSIDKINDSVLVGVGIRVFLGERTVYASTSDISEEGMLRAARSAAEALGESKQVANIRLCPKAIPNLHPVRIDPTAAADRKSVV